MATPRAGDIILWRYNRITGIWDYCRTCASDNAQQWLAAWQKDEPGETFKLSKNTPKGRPQ